MPNKICKKGYRCGSSCISVTYMCKKDFPEGVSVSIDGARKVILNKKPEQTGPDKVRKDIINQPQYSLGSDEHLNSLRKELDRNDLKDFDIQYEEKFDAMTVGGLVKDSNNFFEIDINAMSKNPTVSFTVNGSMDVGGTQDLTRKERREIAIEITKVWRAIVKSSPENTIYKNIAYSLDGRSRMRINAYSKAGFSNKPGSLEGYGIVKNGKLFPYEDVKSFSEPTDEEKAIYQLIFGEEWGES